jgi:hypothetical protein
LAYLHGGWLRGPFPGAGGGVCPCPCREQFLQRGEDWQPGVLGFIVIVGEFGFVDLKPDGGAAGAGPDLPGEVYRRVTGSGLQDVGEPAGRLDVQYLSRDRVLAGDLELNGASGCQEECAASPYR